MCEREIKIISVIRLNLILVEDHLFVQPKNIYSYVPQQRVAPGIKSYASATNSKNEKVCIMGDDHLKQISKRQFGKELDKRSSYFEGFSGANTKQLNYYIVPTLVDETLILMASLRRTIEK